MNTHPYELFEELWQRYYLRIYSYFRRQFDEHTAEDLCQQTYLNAWRYISCCPNGSIRQNKSWLFSVAKNVKNDHLRYIQLRNMNYNYLDIYENDVPVNYDFDEALHVQKALNKLKEEDRELLSMAEYLNSREIGSVLGISASAARSRIQKVREKLKGLLDETH